MTKIILGITQPIATALILELLILYTPLKNVIPPKSFLFFFIINFAVLFAIQYFLHINYEWYWWAIINPFIYFVSIFIIPLFLFMVLGMTQG